MVAVIFIQEFQWTSIGSGTFANANNASTTYTMPADPATITATFTYNSSGGGSSGGSSDSSTIPSRTQVTSSGRTISQNGVTLTFPAGAVENNINVNIRQINQSSGLNIPEVSQLLSRIMDIIKDNWNYAKPIRMLTLTAQNLTDLPYAAQTSLYGEGPGINTKREKLEKSLDKIREKYGKTAVVDASLLHNDLGFETGAKIDEDD